FTKAHRVVCRKGLAATGAAKGQPLDCKYKGREEFRQPHGRLAAVSGDKGLVNGRIARGLAIEIDLHRARATYNSPLTLPISDAWPAPDSNSSSISGDGRPRAAASCQLLHIFRAGADGTVAGGGNELSAGRGGRVIARRGR